MFKRYLRPLKKCKIISLATMSKSNFVIYHTIYCVRELIPSSFSVAPILMRPLKMNKFIIKIYSRLNRGNTSNTVFSKTI